MNVLFTSTAFVSKIHRLYRQRGELSPVASLSFINMFSPDDKLRTIKEEKRFITPILENINTTAAALL